MTEVDGEIVDRIARWCAEAGRRPTSDAIRSAIAPLSWDELLAVKALLADPPPARPLGPHALADIARGALPEIAAEREREGRYRGEPEVAGSRPGAPQRSPGRSASLRTSTPVIRRVRDRPLASAPPAPAPRPSLEELRLPEGRGVLERLLRRVGALRSALVAELAAGWVRPDGASPVEEDLSSLLEHHGLSRAFEHRERDELLHALRAARGVRAVAADRVALDVAGLEDALERLGATEEGKRIREERRSELRARTTLSERVRLLLVDEPRLADLGLLGEFEQDLRRRLPEHLRALRAGPEPLRPALRRSLALSRAALDALVARFALDLGHAGRGRGAPEAKPPQRREARRSEGPRRPPGARTREGPPPNAAPARGARRGPRGTGGRPRRRG